MEKEHLTEIGNLENKIKNMEGEFIAETSRLDQKYDDEQKMWKTEIFQLTQSLDIADKESTELRAKQQSVEEELSGTIEVCIEYIHQTKTEKDSTLLHKNCNGENVLGLS